MEKPNPRSRLVSPIIWGSRLHMNRSYLSVSFATSNHFIPLFTNQKKAFNDLNSDIKSLLDLLPFAYDLCTNTVFTKRQNGCNLRQIPKQIMPAKGKCCYPNPRQIPKTKKYPKRKCFTYYQFHKLNTRIMSHSISLYQ